MGKIIDKDKKRVAVIGISVCERAEASNKVNNILSDFGPIIIGRMGVPYREKNLNIISLIVDGTNEEVGALSGKLGNIKNVKAKVSYMI